MAAICPMCFEKVNDVNRHNIELKINYFFTGMGPIENVFKS